jgi:transposase
MVVVVGIDVHKGTHCAVAVDQAGRQLLRWTGRAFARERVEFAVEDCRHVSGRLERALLDAAATVVRVPPKLMALTRTSARTRGKSDPIDALAIARAALREPSLLRAEHTHASREVKQLERLRARLEVLPASTTRRIAPEELADIRAPTPATAGTLLPAAA